MVESLHIVCPPAISVFFCFTPCNSSSARLGQNRRASTSISSITNFLVINMFARSNCELSGEYCIFYFDAVLIHLRILNWLVVNSPGAVDYPGPTPRY